MASYTPDTFRVEPADPRSPSATRLIAELSAELARLYDRTGDGPGHFRPQDALAPGGIFLIGWLDGQPVACGAIRPVEHDVGEVKRMYVRPEARGRGFSKRVLAVLEAVARESGYHALILETGERQPEAIRLYEGAGYARTEPFGVYLESEHSLSFRKAIG
jgi:GNAT superfamily N-acetyltransferase